MIFGLAFVGSVTLVAGFFLGAAWGRELGRRAALEYASEEARLEADVWRARGRRAAAEALDQFSVAVVLEAPGQAQAAWPAGMKC